MVRVLFLNDSAANAIEFGGAIANIGGTLDVRQSTFSGDCGAGNGAAIYNAANSTGGGALTVLDSTFVNNVSGGSGGALDLDTGSQATVADSTFTGNVGGGHQLAQQQRGNECVRFPGAVWFDGVR